MSARYVVEADGGSRGNPGQAAYGAVVRDAQTGEVLLERAERIGIASNNVAEYRGLIAGLEAVRELDAGATVEVRMDSKLVVEQMSGRWQVKHPDMKVLAKQALAVLPRERLSFTWVPRERNKAADRLVNAVLDGKLVDDLPPLDLDDPAAAAASPAGARTNHVVGWAPELGVPTSTVLVRHGETAATRRRVFSGSGGADPGLTEVGEEQAAALGRLLMAPAGDEPGFAAVVSSPMRRTLETARIVAGALGGLEVVVDEDLRETAFGDWDGYSYAEVAARWPDELAAWLGSTAVAPPFGEAFDDVQRRVVAARVRLAETYAGRNVVVVTHVTPIKALVREALGAPPHALFRMELSPGSATTIHWWGGDVASLRSFNVLPADSPRTGAHPNGSA